MSDPIATELEAIHRSLDRIERLQRFLLRARGIPVVKQSWTPFRERLHAAVKRHAKKVHRVD